MTSLQFNMLKKIAQSDYTKVNGREPKSVDDIGQVWADTIIENPEDKGVFTSLMNAGMVSHTGGNDPDAGCSLTEDGFATYQKIAFDIAAETHGQKNVFDFRRLALIGFPGD